MARIPTAQRQVSEQVFRGDIRSQAQFQAPDLSPISEFAKKKARELETIELQDLINKDSEQITQRFYSDDDALMRRELNLADGLVIEGRDFLKKQFSDNEANISNPRVKELYRAYHQRESANLLNTLARKESRELTNHRKVGSQALVKNLTEMSSINADDDEIIKNNYNVLRADLYANNKLDTASGIKSNDADFVQAQEQGLADSYFTSVIKSGIETDPRGSLKRLEGYKGYLSQEVYDALRPVVEREIQTVNSLEQTGYAMSKGMSPDEAFKHFKSTTKDEKDLNNTFSLFMKDYNRNKSIEATMQNEYNNDILSRIVDMEQGLIPRDYNSVYKDIAKVVDPSARDSLYGRLGSTQGSKSGGGATSSDPRLYEQLYDMALTDKEGFAKEDMTKYVYEGLLSNSDFKSLLKISRESDGRTKQLLTDKELIFNAMVNLGADRDKQSWSDDEWKKNERLTHMAQSYFQDNPNLKPTEKQDYFNRLTTELTIEGFLFDSDKPVYEMIEENQFLFNNQGELIQSKEANNLAKKSRVDYNKIPEKERLVLVNMVRTLPRGNKKLEDVVERAYSGMILGVPMEQSLKNILAEED